MTFKVGDKALFVGATNPVFMVANNTVVTVEGVGPFPQDELFRFWGLDTPEYAVSGAAIPNTGMNDGLCFTWEKNLIPLLPDAELEEEEQTQELPELCKT